jgi:hypothetical protein
MQLSAPDRPVVEHRVMLRLCLWQPQLDRDFPEDYLHPPGTTAASLTQSRTVSSPVRQACLSATPSMHRQSAGFQRHRYQQRQIQCP